MSNKLKIQTVCGQISPSDLGITLPHEHLLDDASVYYKEPEEASKRVLANAPITLENRGEIMYDHTLSKENLRLSDINLITEEVMEFKALGGSSIVELTSPGIGRDPIGMRKISQKSGIHVICASGFYVGNTHPPFVKDFDVDDVCNFVVKEITVGIQYPTEMDIKAGIIKCGLGYPISIEEEKVLRGLARAQRKTNAPFTIHPPLRDFDNHKKIFELEKVLDIVQDEGANMEKLYLSHSDDFCSDDRRKLALDYLKGIMNKYPIKLSFDKFGNEGAWSGWWPGALSFSDEQGLRAITELCEQGYSNRLVLSHDVFVKVELKKYGGWGYSHILEHIVPRLKFYGISEEQINTMMIENPKNILSF